MQEDNEKKKGHSSHLTCECGYEKETCTFKVIEKEESDVVKIGKKVNFLGLFMR